MRKIQVGAKVAYTRGNMLNCGSQMTFSSLCILLQLVILYRTRQRVHVDKKKRH